jgi:hypothetical protein
MHANTALIAAADAVEAAAQTTALFAGTSAADVAFDLAYELDLDPHTPRRNLTLTDEFGPFRGRPFLLDESALTERNLADVAYAAC